MKILDGEKLLECTIVVDDTTITRCKVSKCQVAFAGGELPLISYSNFEGCSFILVGPARRTIDYMRMLYRGGFTSIVDTWISDIRGEQNPAVKEEPKSGAGEKLNS